ncbi:hypothetical protein [Falsiroseomonas stagni]|uniref:Uncharacterized protein n=1 Tax=Falsiroseomonas stagni DSM 19981 TaxID=1123062 RepID=A0A1I4AAP5_9PROT|nr:hypothetical protein [Falsiroseomonas stagni]SFK53167.1 hypothetical protein SAMN02745775_103262 [Falsiroseomonas stagni DSM 19981]
MRKPEPRTLPRFAPRRPVAPGTAPGTAPGAAPGAAPGPEAPARHPRPRLARALEVLHKLLTGGAALGAILRLLF